ncbi:MAG TPA: bacillithiol biosynthesis cysteine-adding enzyme BshC [Gemmatimonadaceae bacterium]|nr:bacillithiol biosynthesis cysteine-adding enzyme BshC [Gemmatimonadaceae bacterium]
MTLRVISTPLAGKKLTRAALDGSLDAAWYTAPPRGSDGWRARADAVIRSMESPEWLTALEGALEPSGPAADRLAAAQRDGFVVTCGQQPGLFGGPLYTWWKALSALEFANALQATTGRPVAPVFWAATDDSDFDEARSTVMVTPDGAQRIELAGRDDPGLPMALVPLGDATSQLEALRRAAGSAPHAGVLDVIARAYKPGETIGSSFVKLLREVLTPRGIAVLDSSHDSVRERARPLLQRALQHGKEVEAALVARDSEIKSAGFSPQVQTVRGRSLVFSATDGRRARVSLGNPAHVSSDSALESLSPNVLLRPIVERHILPTVAYLGGPAEIAYFAQVGAVAAALGSELPLILPRWSGMVVEPRIHKILERHSLSPADFSDPHAVETRLAAQSLPHELRASLVDLRRTVEEQVARLAERHDDLLVSPRVLEGLRRNLLHRVERLERRYTAAVKREGSSALHEIAAARASLYPFGVPQERILNGIPLMARYGDELFDSVMPEVRDHVATLV